MTTQARLHRGELKVFPMSFVRIAIWMFTMWCFTMTCIGQHLEGEMVVKSGLLANRTRVVLHGETLRPGQAAGRCSSCVEARELFLRAKRIRAWSWVIGNLGIAESALGITKLEDAVVLGTFHAAIGGGLITWAAERDVAVRRAVREGVDAYNRCQFMREFMRN